jgi:phosphatidylserine/phosphatidylglycerophosphate/cardiolipin synthase-like enzyme
MKKSLIFTLFLLSIFTFSFAQNTILEARNMPIGTVVTVKGIAINGSELASPIRYFQDATAGIAAYGSAVDVVNRGDTISVTGTLKNYNQLLELDPITSVVVNSTGNTIPQPVVLTPNQISEPYEGMLVKVNNVVFNDAGLLFTGNKKYQFTSNGEIGYIYVKDEQNLVGTIIPTGEVSLTAICSQFDYSNPNAGYQLLPRDLNDIGQSSSIYLTGSLSNTAFTKTTLDFSWTTNTAGTTQMYYGPTAETVTSNIITGTGGSTDHSISLSGLNPGEITWVEAFSVTGSDTAFSAISSFATISNSSGDIKTYFNSPVDISYSNGVNAIYLPSTMDDTLIKYIERSKYTIDFTIYNFNNTGISNISNALKAAANRGVRVRVIGCGTTANLGIDELAGSAVHVLIGPSSSQRTGIMHNKFIVIDAQSTNPNDPLVWTGSTNFTDGQINLDANNVIIIQDQSLARAYQIEFEEMWGSYGDEPNAANARFGATKKNNTPHKFVIDGKPVECYFSPTDGVNAKIVEVINTANSDLSIATMLITRTEMANAIAARKTAGVAVNVITDAEGSNNATVNTTLTNSLSTHFTFDEVSSGMLHHKYMIVDQAAPGSDPMIFTGSHNWSAAADNDNDENTLIIHDTTLSNIYYQQFVKRFVDNMGVLFELTTPPTAVNDFGETGIAQLLTVQVLDNDVFQAPVTISVEQQATHGNAYIPFGNPNVVSYSPEAGFIGQDSAVYKITYQAAANLSATAKIYFTVTDDSGINDYAGIARLNIYPNPAKDEINIPLLMPIQGEAVVKIFDLIGNQKFEITIKTNEPQIKLNIGSAGLKAGVYMVSLQDEKTLSAGRLIISK